MATKITLNECMDALTTLGRRIQKLETRAENCDAEHDRTKRRIDKLDTDFGEALEEIFAALAEGESNT